MSAENLDLAATARRIADSAPAGSLEQAAAGSVAVTCATTRNVAEARSVLTGVTPEEVRRAALELLDRLEAERSFSTAHVLAAHPEAFADKSRFSMDWYYPVLGGAVRGSDGVARLESEWDVFVVPGLGVRCVSDQPWVTGAESCELVLALDALGDRDRALRIFADMQHLRHEDGSYWTGWQFVNRRHFPHERSAYTAAAVILAADALSNTTPAAGVFRDVTARSLPTPTDPAACGCAPARSGV